MTHENLYHGSYNYNEQIEHDTRFINNSFTNLKQKIHQYTLLNPSN